MAEDEEIEGNSPLAFLEKSHCISIILALSHKGIMNRNQLYDELGQTISIVIKRIDLLIEKEVIYEFKMPVKPFAKNMVLTEKGKQIAHHLEEIEKKVKIPGTGKIKRINFPVEELTNTQPHNDPEFWKKYINQMKEDASKITCSRCGEITYLAKDGNKSYWVCTHCGQRDKAKSDDIRTVVLAEHYG